MPDQRPAETVEFLVGFWLGALGLYLSVIRVAPAAIFVPDSVLSMVAGFAAGLGYPTMAKILGGIALVLLPIGLVLVVRQGAG